LDKIIKIAVTGPESTGKSVLSQQLAEHYHTVWVPEFARLYLLNIGRPYVYADILEISKGQVESEKIILSLADKMVISDTELLVTKIWCDVKFGKCHSWIEEQLIRQEYHLYLLMDVDLPWQFDPMRENPHDRDFLMGKYVEELNRLGFNYRIVSGEGEERLRNAIMHVNEMIFNK
jgi:NadR type nicotinamide-nucleotide adenylyltransferase